MWAFSSCGGRDSLVLELWDSRWVGSLVAALGLSSCGTQAQLLCHVESFQTLGIKPVSPALAGRFLSTAPPGKFSSGDFNMWLRLRITALNSQIDFIYSRKGKTF